MARHRWPAWALPCFVLCTLLSPKVTLGAVDFFSSPYNFGPQQENAVLVDSLFRMDTCSIDSTCVEDMEHVQKSVVQLTHGLIHNFCSGTLIKGPGDKIYILTARHCLVQKHQRFIYPLSSYDVIFDYKLPCNASQVDNVSATFDRFLTGLAVVFEDVTSDTAVLELLQDIPPEWGAWTAGWDASGVEPEFTFLDVSQPMGDSQKIVRGRVVEAYYEVVSESNGNVHVGEVGNCTTEVCGFLYGKGISGGMGPGSSGSGVIDAELGKVIGTASAMAANSFCSKSEDTSGSAGMELFIGTLMKAWDMGFHKLFGRRVDGKRWAEYEKYTRHTPTLTIGNVVPEVNPRRGPTRFSVVLQQRPVRNTTITLTPGQPGLVRLSHSKLTFTRADWSQPQYVEITAVPNRFAINETRAFDIDLRWPVVDATGKWSERTKAISGAVWAERKGNSFFNPQEIQLPFRHVISLERYNTNVTLINDREGPFKPVEYFKYTTTGPQGLVIETCPHGKASDNATIVSAVFDQDWSLFQDIPQYTTTTQGARQGCSHTLAVLDRAQDFYVVVNPMTDFDISGQGANFTGKASVTITNSSLSQMLEHLMANDMIQEITAMPGQTIAKGEMYPSTHYFRPETSMTVDVSTCNSNTTIGGRVTVLNDRLEVISTGGSRKVHACIPSMTAKLEGGQTYFFMVTTAVNQVVTRRVRRQVAFTITKV
ncbi:hypothetical protein ACKKBG_A31010 [Auxenochlorella protothecoides x Auxenochlorella symbiontica]